MAYHCLVWQGPAPLLCFSAFNELWEANMSQWVTKKHCKKSNKICFYVVCACVFFPPLVRCGGSVSRHKACGAGHQSDSRVLWEAAAAAEGHQPRVEQPHGLHVAGQARGERTDRYNATKYTDLCRQLLSFITQTWLYSSSTDIQIHMTIEHRTSIHNKKVANNIEMLMNPVWSVHQV